MLCCTAGVRRTQPINKSFAGVQGAVLQKRPLVAEGKPAINYIRMFLIEKPVFFHKKIFFCPGIVIKYLCHYMAVMSSMFYLIRFPTVRWFFFEFSLE